MDTAALIRLVEDTMACTDTSAVKRIIRFQHVSDYRYFLKQLSVRPSSSLPKQSIRKMPIIHGISCLLPEQETLERFGGSVWIEQDSKISVHATPQKSVIWEKGIPGIPWGVNQIKAPQAWSTTTGHRVRVGVIDTGIDFSHPDLRQSVIRGINLLNRSMLPHDDNGHGTHIAGTIAAANQLQGMIGVAPRSLIAPVKAFDHNGSAYVSDIILGIEWCIRNRIHIINMSFGMKNRSKALLGAVINAHNAGVIIVASSGNDGKRRAVDYPARYPQTISVGATTKLRRPAPFSNRGSYIDIYAPGDKIISAWLRGKYNEMSGTSMATSHVSGAVALLLAYKPGLTPTEIKAIIKKSIQPLRGSKARRTIGELDIQRMMQAADKV
ncbi:subtilisin family serine protease [Paenibacillus castaneae]|uniref:S8 family peptidase n=1 Tax=Paenibacillus castaneae TaxID=474957 RepID=UPI000C9BD9FA|nr:S8 family peptidase [Paenibacillus castaneae]NIK79874.1 subtilisin family serine protease [Paenibacillus castaneae]